MTDVLAKVTSGEADAGLVYVTDVMAAGDDVEGIEFPESSAAVNVYPIATVADSESADLAQEFVDLVLGRDGADDPAGRRVRAGALTWPDRPRPGSASRPGSSSPRWRGQAFVLLPLVAIVLRTPWSRFLELITSEASREALLLSLRTSAHQHPAVRPVRRPDGGGPGAHQLPRAGRPALPRAAAAGAAAGRRRHRAALHVRAPRAARRDLRGARHPGRVLDHRGGDGPDLRRHAVPRGQPRGRAAHRRAAVRGGRRVAGRPTHDGVPPGHPAAGAARAGLGRRAGLRPSLGEFGATITFAGSLQGVTRTLPLEIYLRRETDAQAAVALSLVLVVVAVLVIGFARQGRSSL